MISTRRRSPPESAWPLLFREMFDFQVSEQFVDPVVYLVCRQTQRLKDDADVFFHGQFFEYRRFLGQISDAFQGPFMDRQVGDDLAVEQDIAVIGLIKPTME